MYDLTRSSGQTFGRTSDECPQREFPYHAKQINGKCQVRGKVLRVMGIPTPLLDCHVGIPTGPVPMIPLISTHQWGMTLLDSLEPIA